MPREAHIPDILVLTSISPKEQDGMLVSPNLSLKLREYSPFEGEMWGEFLDTPPGELIEDSKARRLADYYHLKTAEKLQGITNHKQLWIERFNQAGEEIYGAVDPQEVIKIVATDLAEIEQGTSDDYLVSTLYRQILGESSQSVETIDDFVEFEVFRDALFERYSIIAETIGTLPEGPYDAAMVRIIFEDILDKLAEQDSDYADWKITNPEGKTMLAVVAPNKEVEVPDGRLPVASREELLELSFHELGGHMQRAVNGYKIGDDMMSKNGLPGYIDFEEGVGLLLEYCISGKYPDKIKDRYVDIALATGAVNGIRLSRNELIQLGISRDRARERVHGRVPADDASILKKVTNDINRYFRGGDGQPILDENGIIITQPIFVKDIVYYQGFVKARNFVLSQLKSGYSPEQILTFLLSGKFDATNPKHLSYIKERYSISLETKDQTGLEPK